MKDIFILLLQTISKKKKKKYQIQYQNTTLKNQDCHVNIIWGSIYYGVNKQKKRFS